MGEVEGSIPSWPLLAGAGLAGVCRIEALQPTTTHWWPSGLRRYVQVVVYYVGAGSNPAQCTILLVFHNGNASVAQLVERSAVNR